MTETITGLFRSAALTWPDNTAFHYFRGTWNHISYRELSFKVAALASQLINKGLKHSDRTAIFSENRYEWCVAYLAALSAGCIIVPLDSQLNAEEVRTLLTDAEAGAIFHSSATADRLTAYAEHFRQNTGRDLLKIDFDSLEYQNMERTAAAGAFYKNRPEETASIIYTSGTTGNPKGVMLSHNNFCTDARALIDARIVTHEDNVLSVLPLHHTYAFMCTFLVPIFLAGAITYPLSIKGPDMISAIQGQGVSIVIGVPQLLGMIRNGILNKIRSLPRLPAFLLIQLLAISGTVRRQLGLNFGKFLFRSAHRNFGPRFRFFASGGAKLDPAIMEDLGALGFTVLEGYGLTETSPVVTFNPPEKQKAGSAGKPLPSVELRIANPSGAGEGEIEIKGPMVMQGYYKRSSATAEVLQDGWFRTGDIGRFDSDGYLFITGRSKEVIVLSSGKNIYPEDVEKIYLGSRLITEICVTGVEHQGITESLHAVIVPDFEYAKQAHIANLRDAVKWEINDISGRLPSYMRIKGFSLRKDPLPRTPLGKLRRFMIKASQERSGPDNRALRAAEAPGDELSRKVLQAVTDIAGLKEKIHSEDNLELDLGLDSLSKIELVAALEQAFTIKLSEDFMSDVHTVGELAGKIRFSSTGPQISRIERTGWKEIISDGPEEQIILEKPEALMISARVAYGVLKILMKLFFRLEVKGTENIPFSGSFILAPNHTSYLDGFIVVLSLPFSFFRNLYSLGTSDFFAGALKSRIARISHVIPIDSSSYLNRALQTSAHVIRHGRSLCVFPEGGRSADGSLLEFKKGLGILALEMEAPVVPVYIKGAFEAFPRTASFPRPAKISVIFGRPLSAKDIDLSEKPADMDSYQYFASMVRERVFELSRSA
jgi:long-chain acyl-CoA synthetase